jgi:hypothetical protein
MKKTLITLLTVMSLLLSVSASQAQEIKRMSSWGANFITDRISFVWTKEYGLGDIPITLGFRTMGYYGSDAKVISLFIGPTVNYHFGQHIDMDHDKIDLYAGATVGADLFFAIDNTKKITNVSGLNDSFRYRTQPFLQLGGKYFFTDRIGLYVQGNFDIGGSRAVTGYGSSIEAGISFKRK